MDRGTDRTGPISTREQRATDLISKALLEGKSRCRGRDSFPGIEEKSAVAVRSGPSAVFALVCLGPPPGFDGPKPLCRIPLSDPLVRLPGFRVVLYISPLRFLSRQLAFCTAEEVAATGPSGTLSTRMGSTALVAIGSQECPTVVYYLNQSPFLLNQSLRSPLVSSIGTLYKVANPFADVPVVLTPHYRKRLPVNVWPTRGLSHGTGATRAGSSSVAHVGHTGASPIVQRRRAPNHYVGFTQSGLGRCSVGRSPCPYDNRATEIVFYALKPDMSVNTLAAGDWEMGGIFEKYDWLPTPKPIGHSVGRFFEKNIFRIWLPQSLAMEKSKKRGVTECRSGASVKLINTLVFSSNSGFVGRLSGRSPGTDSPVHTTTWPPHPSWTRSTLRRNLLRSAADLTHGCTRAKIVIFWRFFAKAGLCNAFKCISIGHRLCIGLCCVVLRPSYLVCVHLDLASGCARAGKAFGRHQFGAFPSWPSFAMCESASALLSCACSPGALSCCTQDRSAALPAPVIPGSGLLSAHLRWAGTDWAKGRGQEACTCLPAIPCWLRGIHAAKIRRPPPEIEHVSGAALCLLALFGLRGVFTLGCARAREGIMPVLRCTGEHTHCNSLVKTPNVGTVSIPDRSVVLPSPVFPGSGLPLTHLRWAGTGRAVGRVYGTCPCLPAMPRRLRGDHGAGIGRPLPGILLVSSAAFCLLSLFGYRGVFTLDCAWAREGKMPVLRCTGGHTHCKSLVQTSFVGTARITNRSVVLPSPVLPVSGLLPTYLRWVGTGRAVGRVYETRACPPSMPLRFRGGHDAKIGRPSPETLHVSGAALRLSNPFVLRTVFALGGTRARKSIMPALRCTEMHPHCTSLVRTSAVGTAIKMNRSGTLLSPVFPVYCLPLTNSRWAGADRPTVRRTELHVWLLDLSCVIRVSDGHPSTLCRHG